MKKEEQKGEPEQEAPPKITNSVSTRQEAQLAANQPKELLQEKPNVNETLELISLRQRLSDQEEAAAILQSKLK